jgi:hypothetical protein
MNTLSTGDPAWARTRIGSSPYFCVEFRFRHRVILTLDGRPGNINTPFVVPPAKAA